MEVCEHFEEQKRIDANVASITQARGWAMLQHGFAGDGGKLLDPIDLLPFPAELRKDSSETRTVSQATERIMRSLLKTEKLPPHIVAQIEAVL